MLVTCLNHKDIKLKIKLLNKIEIYNLFSMIKELQKKITCINHFEKTCVKNRPHYKIYETK